MLNEISKEEVLREVREFVKFVRRMAILFTIVLVVMLIPISGSFGQPLSLYLLRITLNSPFISIPKNISLIMGEPTGPIKVILASALFFAVLIGSPIGLVLFYQYIRPALYPNERKKAITMTAITAAHFYSGIIYGLLIIAPLTIRIMVALGAIAGAEPLIVIAGYYEFIVISVIATAIGFLIPVAIYVANKVFGIDLNLRKYWRYILVIGYAIIAVITPDPTPITALLILGPPLILSIIAEFMALRKRKCTR